MAKYINFEDVRVRVQGKVRFADDTTKAESEGKMPRALANRLIDEAEGQVEMDLSPRYFAPFQHLTTGTYKALPDVTKNIIRTLCELMACIRFLETDFGQGTAVEGAKYTTALEKRYNKMLEKNVLAKPKDMETSKQWSFPPLPMLKKNYFNTEADNGYVGTILHSTSGDGGYAEKQVNDPGENWFSYTPDEDAAE